MERLQGDVRRPVKRPEQRKPADSTNDLSGSLIGSDRPPDPGPSHTGDRETLPGAGMTFHVDLVACPQEKLISARKKSGTIVSDTKTLPVVEDDEALRDLPTELLQSYGHRVSQAEDGMAGRDRFTRHGDNFSAVIRDIGLPRMSGEDLFTRIRKMDPGSCIMPAEILCVIRGVIDVRAQTVNEASP